VPSGNFAKAASVGAKTVKGPSLFSVSTKSAACTGIELARLDGGIDNVLLRAGFLLAGAGGQCKRDNQHKGFQRGPEVHLGLSPVGL
jgi:hypothetical protein